MCYVLCAPASCVRRALRVVNLLLLAAGPGAGDWVRGCAWFGRSRGGGGIPFAGIAAVICDLCVGVGVALAMRASRVPLVRLLVTAREVVHG
jgi:hypothetical protein